jgi:uncharacterized protein YqgV (UPF0045/DUF77 family)
MLGSKKFGEGFSAEAFRRGHEAVFEQGALRVVTTLKLDERWGKAGRSEWKVRAGSVRLE